MSTTIEENRVELRDGSIEFFHATSEEMRWRTAVDQIQVVGEYTTPAGPARDDYFLVFVDNREAWHEVPVGTLGLDKLLLSLSQHLESDLALELANSVDFRSRVLWPLNIKEKDLFEFQERRTPGVLGSAARLLGFQDVERRLSSSVEGYIK